MNLFNQDWSMYHLYYNPWGKTPVQDMATPLVVPLESEADKAATSHGRGTVSVIIPTEYNAVKQQPHKGSPVHAVHMQDIYSTVRTRLLNFATAHIIFPSNLQFSNW